GNIILTDYKYMILTLLRKRLDQSTDEKFAVNETYAIENVRQQEDLLSIEKLSEILKNSQANESIKKILNPLLPFGSAVVDECLLKAGFNENCLLGKNFDVNNDVEKLHNELKLAMNYLHKADSGDCKLKQTSGFRVNFSDK
ncbi:unnamed protein product, partial [Didymodactylos carnosus]